MGEHGTILKTVFVFQIFNQQPNRLILTGSDLAIVLHDGPDPHKWFTEGMAASAPIADEWRKMAAEVHGMGPDSPMPVIAEVASFG